MSADTAEREEHVRFVPKADIKLVWSALALLPDQPIGFGTLRLLRNRDHIHFDQHARPCELTDIEKGMYGL